MLRIKRILLLVLVFLFSCALVFSSAYAEDQGTEFGVEDDLTVLGNEGTDADPDLEVKGYSSFSATPTNATSVTSGAGSVYMENNLEIGGNAYLLDNVGIGTIAPTDRLEVSGGDMSNDAGQKINVEGASGDSYMEYDSTTGRVNIYINGEVAAYMEN